MDLILGPHGAYGKVQPCKKTHCLRGIFSRIGQKKTKNGMLTGPIPRGLKTFIPSLTDSADWLNGCQNAPPG